MWLPQKMGPIGKNWTENHILLPRLAMQDKKYFSSGSGSGPYFGQDLVQPRKPTESGRSVLDPTTLYFKERLVQKTSFINFHTQKITIFFHKYLTWVHILFWTNKNVVGLCLRSRTFRKVGTGSGQSVSKCRIRIRTERFEMSDPDPDQIALKGQLRSNKKQIHKCLKTLVTKVFSSHTQTHPWYLKVVFNIE